MVKSALPVANQMWGFCYSNNKVLNRISTSLTSNSYSSNTLRRLSGTISFKPIQSRKKLVNGSFMVFTWRHGGHVGTPKNSSEVQWGLNTFFMQNFRLFQEIWITTDQVRESDPVYCTQRIDGLVRGAVVGFMNFLDRYLSTFLSLTQ